MPPQKTVLPYSRAYIASKAIANSNPPPYQEIVPTYEETMEFPKDATAQPIQHNVSCSKLDEIVTFYRHALGAAYREHHHKDSVNGSTIHEPTIKSVTFRKAILVDNEDTLSDSGYVSNTKSVIQAAYVNIKCKDPLYYHPSKLSNMKAYEDPLYFYPNMIPIVNESGCPSSPSLGFVSELPVEETYKMSKRPRIFRMPKYSRVYSEPIMTGL